MNETMGGFRVPTWLEDMRSENVGWRYSSSVSSSFGPLMEQVEEIRNVDTGDTAPDERWIKGTSASSAMYVCCTLPNELVVFRDAFNTSVHLDLIIDIMGSIWTHLW